MPRQVPTTLRRRFSRSTPAEEASSITFLIGRRGSRPQHPLPNRPPALQAFRSDLSRTPSVSTHGCHGSLSYPRVPAEFNPGERDYYTMFRSTIGELILPPARDSEFDRETTAGDGDKTVELVILVALRLGEVIVKIDARDELHVRTDLDFEFRTEMHFTECPAITLEAPVVVIRIAETDVADGDDLQVIDVIYTRTFSLHLIPIRQTSRQDVEESGPVRDTNKRHRHQDRSAQPVR